MSQRKLRAACFDLDGTLIDTGPLHVQAEHLALKTLGIPEPAPDHPVTFGTGVMPGLETLAAHYGFDSAETVLNAYLPAWNSLFEDGLQQMPGADQVLRGLCHSVDVKGLRYPPGPSGILNKWRASLDKTKQIVPFLGRETGVPIVIDRGTCGDRDRVRL